MMNNNKILTVSYGTFSCTLEGFDDSFGTMKAIAEYFRDLASEDRYFGAEPPQPDADMLAHIAQKEISRRVEARQQDGKIVLSAHPDTEAEQQDEVQPAVEAPAAEPVTSISLRGEKDTSPYYVTYQMSPLKALGHARKITTKAPAPNEAKTPDQDVSVQAAEQSVEKPVESKRDTPANKADDVEVKAPEQQAAQVPAVEPDQRKEVAVTDQSDDAIDAFFADSRHEEAVVEDTQDSANIPAPSGSAHDSIAAKLQRIRAVVSKQETKATKVDYSEDEHAEETDLGAQASAKSDLVSDAVHDIEEALDADDAVEMTSAPHSDKDEQSDEEVSSLLSRIDEQSEAESTPETLTQEESTLAEQDADDDVTLAAASAEEDTMAGDDDIEDHIYDEDSTEGLASEDDAEENTKPEAISEPKEVDVPRGRVIKVKRADLEHAIAKGALEEVEPDTHNVDASTSKPDQGVVSTLSDEDEDELARELAAVEATLADGSQEAEDAHELDGSARRVLPTLDADQESDMNRLLAETDNQMDDPEGATRRDAITHLRAAVAARKADAALGGADTHEKDKNAYRSDLAEVVRPRRPASGNTRTERPSEGRPAPLKLVAEQRIDTNASHVGAPVRPRRVAAVAVPETATPAASGFAEFASEMGATKLPDLLEAAAAYMAFVEGLDQFSRPQLMNTVRQNSDEDFSREEGLRYFGQLLRTGKLQKLNGGRFKASDDIGFQPDARAAS